MGLLPRPGQYSLATNKYHLFLKLLKAELFFTPGLGITAQRFECRLQRDIGGDESARLEPGP